MNSETANYNKKLPAAERAIGDLLAKQIDRHLPEAENKVWHGHPVWFLDGNPVAGYSKLKGCVRLLFWSGQSFDEPGLHKEGSFKAAEARFTAVDEVDLKALKRWLGKARDIQWDYKNLVRRKGKLEPLKGVGKKPAAARAGKSVKKAEKPKLLSGGNPQIAKADGDAPVQAYIEAMPGWKREVGRSLDALIERTVPGVRKAVRWNSPFYGSEQGWFLSLHCLTKYIKVAFFNGTQLKPMPPVESKNQGTRYFHIYENDQLDEQQLKSWIKQASKIPGWQGFNC